MGFSEVASEVSKTAETKKLDVDADKRLGSETKETKSETGEAKSLEPVDAEKRIEPKEAERLWVDGGSYAEVKKTSSGATHEVHHMPAFQSYETNSELGLAFRDGPAIRMEKGDHVKTASWGRTIDAQDYRAKQAELIKEGNFKEAMQMDIDDIRSKFDDKYDGAIDQMVSYAQEKGLI